MAKLNLRGKRDLASPEDVRAYQALKEQVQECVCVYVCVCVITKS